MRRWKAWLPPADARLLRIMRQERVSAAGAASRVRPSLRYGVGVVLEEPLIAAPLCYKVLDERMDAFYNTSCFRSVEEQTDYENQNAVRNSADTGFGYRGLRADAGQS